MLQGKVLRVARSTDHLNEVVEFYTKGLGLEVLYEFKDHEGFDGVMLGSPRAAYHLEFTSHRGRSVGRAPTEDNLLVFYLPNQAEWRMGDRANEERRLRTRAILQSLLG